VGTGALKTWLDPRAPRWRSPVGRLLWCAVDRALLVLAAAVRPAARRLAPGRGLALVYHRLAPLPGDPASELLPAIAVSDFERQLRHLRRHYRPVSAAALPAAASDHRRGARLPVAVTFDDDHPSHVRHAAPALRRADAPATFFLCGASLDGPPQAFWWERLQRIADRGGDLATALPGLPAGLHAAAAVIEGMTVAERERAAEALAAVAGPDPPDTGLDRTDIAALGAEFEVGFHTRRHHSLDTLGDEQLAQALREGRAELEAAAGGPVRTVAYPSGRTDSRTSAAAASAGFHAGYTTSGEPLRRRGDRRLIGRFEPRSPSLGVFALKLAVAPWRRAPRG
jgi:peptidoglycan/xylan/chitin deacetylase (PgdA/CDA1 family)